MNKFFKIGGAVVGAGVVVVGLLGAGGWMWASAAVDAALEQTWETHTIDFPVPFPLTGAEIAELGEEAVDLDALALERARARGKHYVEAVYVCAGCHGADFGGGKMIDDPAIGTWLGPNITSGGKTDGYSVADWDRAVRHGVLPNGKTSLMPVLDFFEMTDHELSDIIAYIESLPPKPGKETVRTMGPIGTMLVATGQLVPDVARHPDHQRAHAVEPPPVGETVEYGRHLTRVCTGCHRGDLEGGPMPFGPPDWPPAANLTMHDEGLQGWTYAQFVAAMQKGVRPDGTPLRVPMVEILPYAANLTETELKAMWRFLESQPGRPTGL